MVEVIGWPTFSALTTDQGFMHFVYVCFPYYYYQGRMPIIVE